MKRFTFVRVIICLLIVPSLAHAFVPSAPTCLCDVNTGLKYSDGQPGSYTMVSESFENPLWTAANAGTPVTVFYPKERTDAAPVMFFSHGFGGSTWTSYRTLVTHLATRGFVVVYSPYPSSGTVSSMYQIMQNGFEMAARQYSSRMDLSRVGFLGHSFGAGAVPAMAWNGLVQQGWGKQAAFLYMMAPWYSYNMTTAQLQSFPKNVNMIVEVYNEDTVCDHRMGIDIFNNISIPASQKAYYNVVSGAVGPAGHTVPSDREINDLDAYAVRTPLDALINYTFKLTDPCACDARTFALLGYGNHFQHTVTESPAPAADESTYQWPWSSASNPRK